jgi:hypothetical protein
VDGVRVVVGGGVVGGVVGSGVIVVRGVDVDVGGGVVVDVVVVGGGGVVEHTHGICVHSSTSFTQLTDASQRPSKKETKSNVLLTAAGALA